MTYDEYNKAITDMINNPDKLGENGASLLEKIKIDDANRAEAQKTIEEQKKTIADLNNKIFMAATGNTPAQTEEQEKTPREIFNELFDARFYPKEKKDGTD